MKLTARLTVAILPYHGLMVVDMRQSVEITINPSKANNLKAV